MFCLLQPEMVHQVSFVISLYLRSSLCWHPLSPVQLVMNDAFQPVAFSFIPTNPIPCISACLSTLHTCRYWSCFYLVCHVTNIKLLCHSFSSFLLVFSVLFFHNYSFTDPSIPVVLSEEETMILVFTSGGDGICGTGTKTWFLC